MRKDESSPQSGSAVRRPGRSGAGDRYDLHRVVLPDHPEEAGYTASPPAVPPLVFALAAANVAAATNAAILILWERATGAPLEVVPFGGGDPTSLQVTSVISATLVPSMIGAAIFLLFRNYFRSYRVAYAGLVALVLVLSFTLPLSLSAGAANTLMLMGMHAIAAALNIGGVLVGDRISRVGWHDGIGE